MREIRARGFVPVSPEAVFDFLAELENHWQLAGRFVEVVCIDPAADGGSQGGRVRLRGPLGLRRTATTRVLAADPPLRLLGMARVGGGTRAFVRWNLRPRGEGTEVSLDATVDRAGWLDRLLLLLGGRRWLERRFGEVLGRLERHLPAALSEAQHVV